jgi:hypothetical protein
VHVPTPRPLCRIGLSVTRLCVLWTVLADLTPAEENWLR